jgi:uncharacterized protein involved in exopolysaccharide biosynthesis
LGVGVAEHDDGEVTQDDLRQLEAALVARFWAFDERFADNDEQFAALDARIKDADRRVQSLERQTEARLRSAERQLDDARNGLERVRANLAGQIDHARRDLGRVLLLGLAGVVVSTAVLCIGTLLVVLVL